MEQQAPPVGERIVRVRKLRRMNQADLAREAHVSLSLLSKVEAGSRAATPGLLAQLAPVLGVSADELTGPAMGHRASDTSLVHLALSALHAVLLRHDVPLEPLRPVRSLAQLRVAVVDLGELRARGAYNRMAQMLPDLADELTWSVHTAPSVDRPEVFRQLTHTYFAAHAMAYKHGYDQLASLAEERIGWSARATGDPMLSALAAWTRGHSLLATGGPNLEVGLRLLGAARHELDGLLGEFGAEGPSVYGALLLREAVLAARLNNPDLAKARIGYAREMVARGARDNNSRSVLTSGEVNSRIVEVAVAVELGDAEAAIVLSRELTIPPDFPRVRASHHYIDLGRALTWAGRREQALASLLTAERYARQQTLWHPGTRETVGRLMSVERRASDALLSLVARIKQAGAPSPLR